MAKNEEKALTTVSDYAVMQHSVESLQSVIANNVGAGNLGPTDLDRIKVPSGGGTTWEIPSLDGDIATKELDGVIVAWKEPRAYWAESLSATGGGSPPDCSSEDGITGTGDPGGVCAKCPHAQFGSAVGDDGQARDGQACRQMRMMAVVRKDELIPMLLIAPPTSIAPLRRYFLRLASQVVPYYGVVTRFTLKKMKSKAGIEYSQLQAQSIEKLTAEQMQKMAGYAQVIGKSLERRAAVDAEDFGE